MPDNNTVSGIKKRARRNLRDLAEQRKSATEEILTLAQGYTERMTGRLDQANSALSRTEADLAKTKEELAADKRLMEEEIEQLKAALEASKSAALSVQTEVISTIDALNTQLHDSDEKSPTLDPTNFENKSPADVAQMLAGTLNTQVKKTVDELAEVRSERDTLKTELLESEEYVDRLHAEIDKDQACITDLQRELREMTAKAERVTSKGSAP